MGEGAGRGGRGSRQGWEREPAGRGEGAGRGGRGSRQGGEREPAGRGEGAGREGRGSARPEGGRDVRKGIGDHSSQAGRQTSFRNLETRAGETSGGRWN
jgi:hypothetical protein